MLYSVVGVRRKATLTTSRSFPTDPWGAPYGKQLGLAAKEWKACCLLQHSKWESSSSPALSLSMVPKKKDYAEQHPALEEAIQEGENRGTTGTGGVSQNRIKPNQEWPNQCNVRCMADIADIPTTRMANDFSITWQYSTAMRWGYCPSLLQWLQTCSPDKKSNCEIL